MTTQKLRELFGKGPETAIVPLVEMSFGPQILEKHVPDAYHAGYLYSYGEDHAEIFIADSDETLGLFLLNHPGAQHSTHRRW
jgi:hypothetical protein